MRYQLSSEWALIQERFQRMFVGLGEVTVSDDILSYNSVQPSVATGVALSSDGELLANMPLHTIKGRFDEVEFQDEPLSFTLTGPNLTYTYTVPSAIVLLRSSD